ncbi:MULTISPECIES: 50S ribosomal protein L15 [unclassified Mycoplasma]|uniref:50S ribosomal protein L15 n=1 Tax=unclassified Mycoplasma TaxID=2683645 RepID=UPI002B1D1FB3|nr:MULTISPECIES: 50S ribosomal protein L15 [unclassified Mycoplasma]MEA4134544.1 50S ribosomal protein L15 [Mycoplasma sp. 2704]MEA4162767.1 50S ribosomal protein L15 [Mycoplasma sp. 4404]MEA4190955.1 50S ribosomal protein L15 [Mycoplasma sp. 2248]MEA4206339.1 50S ribosomal protein L15 [Mycoplasma sp. 1199]MEA4276498.1 50S ribosomal protein L15 [Mycoplasma sp. 21DD0573]
MKLNTLKFTEGSRPEKHRKGRGHAAGKGKQAGKGQSGQNKRKGHRLGFEGGQTPWFRRIGKRGFNNVNHVEYQVINLADLETRFNDGDVITIEALFSVNLIKRNMPVKLLGNGTLTKKLTIDVHKASASAKEAFAKLGGTINEL